MLWLEVRLNKDIERPFLFYWKVGFDRRGFNLGRFLRHIVRDAAIFQFLLSYRNGCVMVSKRIQLE